MDEVYQTFCDRLSSQYEDVIDDDAFWIKPLWRIGYACALRDKGEIGKSDWQKIVIEEISRGE